MRLFGNLKSEIFHKLITYNLFFPLRTLHKTLRPLRLRKKGEEIKDEEMKK
jgi:hypothetical protein